MQQPPLTHSVAVGYMFWIFGFTGAHRFYYGKKLTGLLWFLTAGLLLVGWIIDFFLIPSMNEEAAERYMPGPWDYSAGWLLLFFLGIFGGHRFYLGKWVTGLIWACTGALAGIGLLYDIWTLNEQIDYANRRGYPLEPLEIV